MGLKCHYRKEEASCPPPPKSHFPMQRQYWEEYIALGFAVSHGVFLACGNRNGEISLSALFSHRKMDWEGRSDHSLPQQWTLLYTLKAIPYSCCVAAGNFSWVPWTGLNLLEKNFNCLVWPSVIYAREEVVWTSEAHRRITSQLSVQWPSQSHERKSHKHSLSLISHFIFSLLLKLNCTLSANVICVEAQRLEGCAIVAGWELTIGKQWYF